MFCIIVGVFINLLFKKLKRFKGMVQYDPKGDPVMFSLSSLIVLIILFFLLSEWGIMTTYVH